jgi:hypothetical protein
MPFRKALQLLYVADQPLHGSCYLVPTALMWAAATFTSLKREEHDTCNSCKHNGAVLPLSAAPVGRGADGVDAMA